MIFPFLTLLAGFSAVSATVQISRDSETLGLHSKAPISVETDGFSQPTSRGFPSLVSRGLFASDDDSASASTSKEKETAQVTSGTEIVTFLQVLQQANIKSQACWINLVNATQSEIGTCLRLDTLATLLVQDSANTTFADSASTYLSAMCGQAQCSQAAIDEWKPAFDWDCGIAEDKDTPLVQAVEVTLNLYTSAYRNLACDITFNGTSTNCLSEVLNATSTTNNRDFFANIISGMNLNWYDTSFFGVPWCTGCMFEMYKAAMFLIPSIQSNQQVQWLGGNLSTCSTPETVQWSTVCDRQKPDALTVSQNTNAYSPNGALRSAYSQTILLLTALAVTIALIPA